VSELDLGAIQGFVLRGYRLPAAGYLFLRVEEAAAARRWLAARLPEVLTAAPWSAKPESGLNLAVSFAGLQALGVPDTSLASFPEEFREGMARRADRLGDTGDSAPTAWEAPFAAGDGHVLVMISAQDAAALAAHDGRLRDSLDGAGLRLVAEQSGAALPGGTEHFGFADGFAQPVIEGGGAPDVPGGGAVTGDGWRPIRTGEFVLGYPDEEDALPAAPTPEQLSRNGSFLVYRKLHQDVAGFRRQLAENAALFDGGAELLAAKLVGRWRDGTPLALAPRAPDAALVADAARNNAFDYRDDPGGRRCPVGSHVRRANPRASLPFDGKLVNRHRLVRRGIPYGTPLPPDATGDDGRDRGVVFMCLQASIARQFEFVQSQWLNDGNALRQGDDQDPLVGPQDQTGARKLTVTGKPPFLFGPLSRTVTVRGGEYYFCPGVNGLRFLAALEGSP
jgi:Dyp-type peroxidase family